MIKKKYLKKIAVVAATAALLFQVQPAIAADIFEDGETTAAAEEIQEPEDVRDLPVFYIFSPFISIKTIQYYFLYSYS